MEEWIEEDAARDGHVLRCACAQGFQSGLNGCAGEGSSKVDGGQDGSGARWHSGSC